MTLISLFRIIFSFRLIAAAFLVWFLFSTQVMALQTVSYNPYPRYRVPVNYYPYPRPPVYPNYRYPGYYYPQPVYYSPGPPSRTRVLNQPVNKPEMQETLNNISAEPVISKNTSESKQLFIDKLLPYIEQENLRIKQLRLSAEEYINKLDANLPVSGKAKTWLKKLAQKYRVKGNPLNDSKVRETLIEKIDIIPASLALAQAANESGWGKSRFAAEANNLFGIWTYDESKGLKPEKRDAEKTHLIRKFDHYGQSVSYYMFTLNSHPAYQKLRDIRLQQRNQKLMLDGFAMADGLQKYSAKGVLYIKLIRDLIRQNQWAKLDGKIPSV